MGMIEITLSCGTTIELFYKTEDCGIGVCGDHPTLDIDMQPVFQWAQIPGECPSPHAKTVKAESFDLEDITENDMERATELAREDMRPL